MLGGWTNDVVVDICIFDQNFLMSTLTGGLA